MVGRVYERPVIDRVAEAKCPIVVFRHWSDGSMTMDHGPDCSCQGIGLRWPSLSRECNCLELCQSFAEDKHGRIQDVTLEGVLPLLPGDWILGHSRDGHSYYVVDSVGDFLTPLEAACSALLASIQD